MNRIERRRQPDDETMYAALRLLIAHAEQAERALTSGARTRDALAASALLPARRAVTRLRAEPE